MLIDILGKNTYMALSLKIDFYPVNTAKPEFILEPHWWNISELLKLYPFNRELLNGYEDYHLTVTKELLKAIHKDQLKYLDAAHLKLMESIVMGQLEYIFDSETIFSKIEINIYEWNAG